jgi:hypothetical protein
MKRSCSGLALALRVEAVREGKVDLVAASFSKTPERAKLVDFSLTYFNARQRVFAKKGAVTTLKDLERKRIAVVKGTTTEKILREKVPSATVLALGNMHDVIDLLARGEVDIVSGDGITLYGYFMTVPEEKKDQYGIPADIALADGKYGGHTKSRRNSTITSSTIAGGGGTSVGAVVGVEAGAGTTTGNPPVQASFEWRNRAGRRGLCPAPSASRRRHQPPRQRGDRHALIHMKEIRTEPDP